MGFLCAIKAFGCLRGKVFSALQGGLELPQGECLKRVAAKGQSNALGAACGGEGDRQSHRLSGFNHQIRHNGVTYVEHLVPWNTITGKIRPCLQIHLPGTGGICNAHSAAREGVVKVSIVKVALVAHTGWENAAKLTHFGSFTQRLADGLSPLCGCEGVG